MTQIERICADQICFDQLYPCNQCSILRIKTPNSALYLHHANNQ